MGLEENIKRSWHVFLFLVVAFLPVAASANSGTPLMWATMLHLVFGNAVIGVVEGLLLAWIFKCSRWKSIVILILANYASAWGGRFPLISYHASEPDITIETVHVWFLVFVAVAFVITLFIEFPFFWLALRSCKRSMRQAFLATLMIHGVSYVLLFGWYWSASGTSVMSKLEVVAAKEMKLDEPFSLYFISRDGRQVLRRDLSGKGFAQPIADVVANHRNDRLFARRRHGSGFDLFVYLGSEERGAETEARVRENFSEDAPIDWAIAERNSKQTEGTWFNFGHVPALREESDWKFRTGFWPVEGLRGVNEKTGEKVRFSLEMPFVAWPIRNATQISGDYILAQLGKDQICMFHQADRKIALIARGKGPIVVRPKPSKDLEENGVTNADSGSLP